MFIVVLDVYDCELFIVGLEGHAGPSALTVSASTASKNPKEYLSNKRQNGPLHVHWFSTEVHNIYCPSISATGNIQLKIHDKQYAVT